MNTKLIVRLLGYLIALSGVFVYAQEDPRLWDTEGVSLRQGDHVEWLGSNAVNEFGQTCVVWCDARAGYWDIYAQVIAADGSRLWPDRGLIVNNAEWRQEDPVVIAVDGGWVIAWLDWRYGDRFHFSPNSSPRSAVFAQKLSWAGERLWAADGVEAHTSEDWYILDSSIKLTDDRSGGAIIGWQEYSADGRYGYLTQRINSAGVLEWTNPVTVLNDLGWSYDIRAENDESGNMLVVWMADTDSVTKSIFAAKVTPQGLLPWGDGVNGVRLESVPGNCCEIDICRDETIDGFYLAWGTRGAQYWDYYYYAQRFDVSGNPLWGDSGLLLYEPSDRMYRLAVAPSYNAGEQDGFLLAGRKIMDFTHLLAAQKVDPAGLALWGEQGIEVGEMYGYNAWEEPRIQSDFQGGCVSLWSHNTDNMDNSEQYSFLRAARLSSSGSQLWGDGGITVHRQKLDWRYDNVISYVRNSDYVRALYLENSYLGFKSISRETGNQVSESAVQILPRIRGEACPPLSVPINDSRVAIVWADERDNGGGLYYQIMDTLGTPLLGQNGRRILQQSDALTGMRNPAIGLCGDQDGGFFVLVADPYSDVHTTLLHVEAGQSPIPEPTYCTVNDTTTYYQGYSIAPDGEGGCYAGWVEYTSEYTYATMIQRFNNRCEPLWSEPVRLFAEDNQGNTLQSLTGTSDGGCVASGVFYADYDSGFATKINRSGEILWSSDFADLYTPSLKSKPDADGGVYFTWDNSNSTESRGIRAQHIDSEGNLSWPQDGLHVIDVEGWDPAPLYDEQHGLYIIWRDGSGLLAQRLDEAGMRLWVDEGLRLTSNSDTYNTYVQDAIVNGEGGIFCIWAQQDYYTQASIHGMDVTPDGTPTTTWWTEGTGGLIAEGDRYLTSARLAAFGDGSSLIVWQGMIWGDEMYSDKQSKPNYYYYIDLYMQRIAVGQVIEAAGEIPQMPLVYSLNQNYPNPFNPTTTISFSIAKAGPVSLTVYDLLGRSVTTLMNEHLSSGNYQVPWDASSLPSGMYFYRLNAGEFSDVKKTVLLK
jgi:hypothetical protein